jgi:hypothetical protein
MIENPGFSYTTVKGVVKKRPLSNIKITMGNDSGFFCTLFPFMGWKNTKENSLAFYIKRFFSWRLPTKV